MTGLEEDQEFDFDFLFEFNQSDEGAGVAPGGSARVGGAEPKVQGHGLQRLGVQGRGCGSGVHCPGCWSTGMGCRSGGARVGFRGSRGAGPCDARVMGGGSRGTGVSRRGEVWKSQAGAQPGARAAPPSLSAPVSLGPRPLPRSGQHHSVPTPGPVPGPLWSRRKAGQV